MLLWWCCDSVIVHLQMVPGFWGPGPSFRSFVAVKELQVAQFLDVVNPNRAYWRKAAGILFLDISKLQSPCLWIVGERRTVDMRHISGARRTAIFTAFGIPRYAVTHI